MSAEADLLAGHLTLRLGGEPAIACERPMVGQAMMRRLTEGRRAALLPDLIGTVFALGAAAQRSTARRAVAAAFDLHDAEPAAASDRLLVALATAREHLQRFALDLPSRVPLAAMAQPDAGWLRDAPLQGLPARPEGQAATLLRSASASLPVWLERRVLGLPAQEWLQRWQAAPEAWLDEWSAQRDHPLAAWLRGVRSAARAVTLPCRPLPLLAAGEPGLRALAASLAADPDFAEQPLWQGLAAETGPWTRHGRSVDASESLSLWQRLGARLADLVQLSLGGSLACGALTLAPGEGIAWTEMSRGLLVHWVRLEDGPQAPDTARAAAYRVLAPTEWNFHPHGALAEALRSRRLDAAQARLAAAALDPCIHFDIAEEPAHA
ncbi:hypothetical protein [Piscinibacter sp.]|uniref:hypothetical protein n=1 Tax=Piscinibacter sp. TaxID=1903157 RepID=UPI0035B460C4